MSYILTLAGLLSAALLWIGAALERVGKVLMFVGVMSNCMGNMLQVGVGFAGIGAHTRNNRLADPTTIAV